MSDELNDRRRAIRHLIDEREPVDALADYYAFHHPDFRTQLVTHRPDTAWAMGYVCLSRTGFDLFRPFVTMRLPWGDMEASRSLLTRSLPEGLPVILSVPALYMPLIHAICDVQTADEMALLALDRGRFEPIINVLVTSERTARDLPRYVIHRDDEIAAAAGINWQTTYFADISVRTNPQHRRQGWGRSVVAALAQYIVSKRRTPLYTVSVTNEASMQLAETVGFVDTGHREVLVECALRAF
jgi:GNAT superfamily N-acetyltransferase